MSTQKKAAPPRKTVGEIVDGWNAEARNREVAEIVKVAVLAERERCARIAEIGTRNAREIRAALRCCPVQSCEIAAIIRSAV